MEHTKPGIGLVLSGGGGKGAYETGVWQALDEYGVTRNISAISGTSVGALNAVLFAQGNLSVALNVWETISPEAVMTLNDSLIYQNLSASISDFLWRTRLFSFSQSIYHWINKRCADQGILSKEGLSKLIDKTLNVKNLLSFAGSVYVAAYNISSLELKYFNLKYSPTLEDMRERLLASASIPIIFGKTYIDGDLYWDGGIPLVGDNTPVKPLYEDGYRNLIVVHLSQEEPVDRNKYFGCNIIEIMPKEDLGGIISGTMNFDPQTAAANILRGYNDTVRILAPLFTTGMELNKIENAFCEISREQHHFREKNHLLEMKIFHSATEIDSLLEQLDKGGKH